MSPAKNEMSSGKPFQGPAGKLLDEALLSAKTYRSEVYVTNLCNFYIDDNDLYSVPKEIMDAEINRVHTEIAMVKPNCLIIMGGDTLDLLTATSIRTYRPKSGKHAGQERLDTAGSKDGITKWRGSIFQLPTPSGRMQKCVAAMHTAAFTRGQWKWLPLFKYIDVPRAVTQSSFPEMRLAPREAIIGPSFRQARDFLREANEQEEVSIDYEGISHITCLGVGWTTSLAACVPLTSAGSQKFYSLEEECEIWRLWTTLLQNPKVRKIAQNAAYEWIKSWLYGIYPYPLGADTMHMHHCLYPDWGGISDEWTKRKRDIDNPGHGLALITSQYTDQPYYKDDGRHWRPEHGQEAFWRYNALDVMVTFEAAQRMRSELHASGLWSTYQEMYLDLFPKTLQMEWDGIQIDMTLKAEARIETLRDIDKECQELSDIIQMKVIPQVARKGQKPEKGILNLSSPAQMKAWVTARGYKVGIDRKTGKPKLDKDDLALLYIKHSDEALDRILKINKKQDFVTKTLDMKTDANGRIHTHWRIGGTNGTRLSSSESILGSGRNLQNLDRQGVARRLFLPS